MQQGNWFTDMVRDNFWMVIALWYSRPEPELDVVDTNEYLFDDSPDGDYMDMDMSDDVYYEYDNYDYMDEHYHDTYDSNPSYGHDYDSSFGYETFDDDCSNLDFHI